MSGPRYQRQSLFYSNPENKVTIYTGSLTDNLSPVAIKEELHPTVQAANTAINEAMQMARMGSLGTIYVYYCELEECQGEFKSVIVVELMESDLYKQIMMRTKEQRYWEESELIVYFEALLGVLCQAQQIGISHRDIKPQNIFCNNDGSNVKLGDFGASKSLFGPHMTSTLKGSPFYLSPQLKYIFASMVNGGSSMEYNPFKSDVYSLGVTFLFLMRLRAPVEMMRGLQELEAVTRQLIQEIQGKYPLLAQILPVMLAYQEADRCDFVMLYEYWNQVKMQGCSQIYQTVNQADYSGMGTVAQPAGYLPAQAVQSREIYTVQPVMPPDYYASSGEAQVSQCMVCRMPFNGQGKYCSSQCAQRTVAQAPQPQPIQKPPKKCTFCSHPVLSPCTVPPHLSMYQSFAKEVCSVKCLEQYQRLAADDTTCLGCKQTLSITDPKAPELPCHHKFHSKDCLFQLLETISNKFSIELTFIDCPKCGGCCGLKDVIKYFPGSEYGDRKKWSLETSCTVCRNPAVVRMLRCGHGVCFAHAQGEGVFCICCNYYRDFY